MKTQTDTALIMLVLVVAAVIALAVWSGSQTNVAVAQVNAGAAAAKSSTLGLIGGQMAGWALSTVIGIAALALATLAAAWVKQWWAQRGGKRQWRSGPNAQWQPQREPRTMGTDEMLRMMMMREMMQGQSRRQGQQQQANNLPEDEFPVEF